MNTQNEQSKPELKTLEGNKLIAKFMGQPTTAEQVNFSADRTAISRTVDRHFKYHSSWDWLMPVVEKISRITIEWENSDDRTETYYPRTFGMLNSETGNFMVRFNGNF